MVLLHCFQTHLVCISWKRGNGLKTTHIMLIQTSETKIYEVLHFMLKNGTACLLAHWDLIFTKLFFVSETPTVPSCSGCWLSKKKTSHRSNFNWAFNQSVFTSKGMKPGYFGQRGLFLICKQKYWWIFRNSSLMASVRKIAEITKGSNEISSCTNTAAVLWCCPWLLLQAHSRKHRKVPVVQGALWPILQS